MGLRIFQRFPGWHPENYGGMVSRAGPRPPCGPGRFALPGLALILSAIASMPAKAQQANQPGFDPRQTERRFDVPQSGQPPSARPAVRMPSVSRPEGTPDARPMFVLRGVSLTGAHAIAHDQ